LGGGKKGGEKRRLLKNLATGKVGRLRIHVLRWRGRVVPTIIREGGELKFSKSSRPESGGEGFPAPTRVRRGAYYPRKRWQTRRQTWRGTQNCFSFQRRKEKQFGGRTEKRGRGPIAAQLGRGEIRPAEGKGGELDLGVSR